MRKLKDVVVYVSFGYILVQVLRSAGDIGEALVKAQAKIMKERGTF